ncbi:MAG: hypothetical protein ABI462_05700 [Ignavibacteria bacterium]
MKKILFLFIVLPAIVFITNGPVFSINEYFRSVNSGNWNSTSTWQMSTNSGSSWIVATKTPSDSSGLITIQSPNTVTVTANVNADQLTVNNGGTISINAAVTLTIFDGAGEDLVLISGSIISGAGTFQTKGSNVYLNIHNGSNMTAALKINSGITTVYESTGTLIAYLNCPVTVDAGAVLGASLGSYTIQFNKTLIVNGTLNGGSGSILRIAGSSVNNNGFISGSYLFFDSVTSVSGTGTFTTRIITIPFSGNVSLLSNMTFAPLISLTVNPYGTLNPNTNILTFSSGIFYLRNLATVSNSGTFQTKGTVSLIIRDASNFNCPLKVNTGTTTSYDDGSFFTAIYKGTVVIDAGAALKVNTGAYVIQCNSSLTNNGTISGTSGASLKMKGITFSNNGSITVSSFIFDTGSHLVQGSGTWSTTVNIISGSAVTLSGNFQIRDVNINSGGTLNLSLFKLLAAGSNPLINNGTFDASAGTVEYNGSSVQNISASGITYNKLILNNSSGTILLSNVTVDDTLFILSGDIDLNGKILTISSSGYLSEIPGHTIGGLSGYITTTRDMNAPSSINAGGLGAVITSASNLGSTEIRRGHVIHSGLSGNTSIARYYDIIPTINTGLNATLVFKYDESELNGNPESSLSLFSSTNSGLNWIANGGIPDPPGNSVTLSFINSFSRLSASLLSVAPAQLKLVMEAFYNLTTNRLNMKDTVTAYMRNNSTPFTIVDSARSIIDSVLFTGSFLFSNAPTGTYYIQLKHRNSLETWSRLGGEAYTAGGVLNYDFTTDSSKAFGNNMKKIESKWSVFSGDADQNGNVNLNDIVAVTNSATGFETGYIITDINGDRTVNLQDIIFTFNNSNLFVSKIIP